MLLVLIFVGTLCHLYLYMSVHLSLVLFVHVSFFIHLLHECFFRCTARACSELLAVNIYSLTLSVGDWMWDLTVLVPVYCFFFYFTEHQENT